MPGKTILILSSAHLCRNPRVVKEASALGRAGYDVTVLSLSSHPRFEQVDRELMVGLPFKRVTLDYTGSTQSSRLRSFFQRAATWSARRLCRHLGVETAQALGPATALLRAALDHPTDLTIVHTEIPLWCAPYLIRAGRRVAVDMEDWYSEDLLPEARASRPLRLLRAAESFALNHAVYSSVTAQSMADSLSAAYGCPPAVIIHNSFPDQIRSRVDDPAPSALPHFIWFSQTIGTGRGLEAFLSAWGKSKTPSRVSLMGHSTADYRRELQSLIPETRRSDLTFLDPVPASQLPERLAKFDVGLALEASSPPSRNVTITNKILQYLNAGLAVLVTRTAGQQEVLEAAPDCGLIVNPDDPAELVATIDALLTDPTRLRRMQLAARVAAETYYCWEREEPKLLATVAAALTKPIPKPV